MPYHGNTVSVVLVETYIVVSCFPVSLSLSLSHSLSAVFVPILFSTGRMPNKVISSFLVNE